MKVIKIAAVKEEPVKDNPLFTGPVTTQPIVGNVMKPEMGLSQNILITQVNFAKGVRNKFHTHSIEQILIVTKGTGIVASEKEEIRVGPGDVIVIPAGEKHWHGAAPGATFSHLYVMSPGSKTIQVEP